MQRATRRRAARRGGLERPSPASQPRDEPSSDESQRLDGAFSERSDEGMREQASERASKQAATAAGASQPLSLQACCCPIASHVDAPQHAHSLATRTPLHSPARSEGRRRREEEEEERRRLLLLAGWELRDEEGRRFAGDSTAATNTQGTASCSACIAVIIGMSTDYLSKLIRWWCCPPALPRPPGCLRCLPTRPWPAHTWPRFLRFFFRLVVIVATATVHRCEAREQGRGQNRRERKATKKSKDASGPSLFSSQVGFFKL